MKIEPYLFFNGRCEEAIAFYTTVLGAEVDMLMRFQDAPPSEGQPMSRPEFATKVMHASLKIGESHILVSDGMGEGPTNFAGFTLTITAPDDATTGRLFAALGEGGQVRQPLSKTFFSSSFGMVADKFGLGWVVLTGP